MHDDFLKCLDEFSTQLEQSVFFGHGTDNAWDETAYLLLHTMQLPANIPTNAIQRGPTTEEKTHLQHLINLRINQKLPAAYLTKEAWFCGHPFYIDQRALIPRSPIAELIHDRFSPWLNQTPKRILELCTGSGCIAVATALVFQESIVDATDIDADALDVAKINRGKHRLDSQLNLVQTDLFSGIAGQQQYDLIIANPPYVSKQEMSRLPKEYQHEPTQALQSPNKGLCHIKTILEQAKQFLSPKGLLVGEVGNNMEALMVDQPNLPFLWPEFAFGGHGVFIIGAEDLS